MGLTLQEKRNIRALQMLYNHMKDFMLVHKLTVDDPNKDNMKHFFKYISQFYGPISTNVELWYPVELMFELHRMGLVTFMSGFTFSHENFNMTKPWADGLEYFWHRKLDVFDMTNNKRKLSKMKYSDEISYGIAGENRIKHSFTITDIFAPIDQLSGLLDKSFTTTDELIEFMFETKTDFCMKRVVPKRNKFNYVFEYGIEFLFYDFVNRPFLNSFKKNQILTF